MQNFDTLEYFKNNLAFFSDSINKFNNMEIVFCLLFSLLAGLFIKHIYKKSKITLFYQKNLGFTLVLIPIITTAITLTISKNLVLSLGMIGALSIVRFRAPIKEPIELTFLFWAISVGIADGVGYFFITLFASLIISIFILTVNAFKGDNDDFLLMLRVEKDFSIDRIIESLKKEKISHRILSQVMASDYLEIFLKVNTKNNSRIMDMFINKSGIIKISLVDYNEDSLG